jgi:hypothetical protein
VRASYPSDPDSRRAMLDARLHLLDRQMLDVRTIPVSAVDDVELTDPSTDGPLPLDEPAPEVTNLVTGLSLGVRIFGGRPAHRRLHRIGWGDVYEVGVAVRLAVNGDTLDTTWAERWVRDRIIGKIPGGHHDPE